MTALSEAIKAGRRVITAEVSAPCGADPRRIKEIASALKGKVHAVVLEENVDGVHMSSLAASLHVKSAGVEPVVTLLTRDMNRIALQSAVVGGVSLGITDFLVVSGHHQGLTAERQARGVYDVDSIQAIRIFRAMREEGAFAGGQKMEAPVPICIGGAANPFAGPLDLRALRTQKKVRAGADFIITEPVFDVGRFREWLELLRQKGVPEKVCLIAGVMWLGSADEAKSLNEKYRGMNIPEGIIERLAHAGDARREGLAVAVESAEQVKSLDGIRGFHVWARGRDESVPELLDALPISTP